MQEMNSTWVTEFLVHQLYRLIHDQRKAVYEFLSASQSRPHHDDNSTVTIGPYFMKWVVTRPRARLFSAFFLNWLALAPMDAKPERFFKTGFSYQACMEEIMDVVTISTVLTSNDIVTLVTLRSKSRTRAVSCSPTPIRLPLQQRLPGSRGPRRPIGHQSRSGRTEEARDDQETPGQGRPCRPKRSYDSC